PDGAEQIIQAQFKREGSSNQLTPSQGGSLDSRPGHPSSVPGVVACTRCQARFAAGAKFCGRCGNTTFQPITAELQPPGKSTTPITCARCGQTYPPNTKFCGKCGVPIGGPINWNPPRPVEVFCATCGTSYAASTKF